MKLTGLRQLVKEEFKRILKENMDIQELTPGKYTVEYTIDYRSSFDDMPINITQDDIDTAIEFGVTNQDNFWKAQIKKYDSLFSRGDKIISVEKINDNLSELKKEINELLDDILEENQLKEVTTGQINVGDVFTLSSDIGLFKSGDRVEVKDKGVYGNDVKIVLSNDQGITDEFLLDINDDFEELM